jgi:hypothetical protein
VKNKQEEEEKLPQVKDEAKAEEKDGEVEEEKGSEQTARVESSEDKDVVGESKSEENT